MSVDSLTIVPMDASHIRAEFDCGVPVLNRYLTQQASQDVRRKLAQTYVTINSELKILGYYTLSASAIEHENLPESARKKLPRYPIPAAIIGRLAVDKSCQGMGIARKLLRDALHRTLTLSQTLGIHAVIVDAKDESSAGFYRKFGFLPLSDSTLHLYLPIKTIENAV